MVCKALDLFDFLKRTLRDQTALSSDLCPNATLKAPNVMPLIRITSHLDVWGLPDCLRL